jgi:hypothetical protein
MPFCVSNQPSRTKNFAKFILQYVMNIYENLDLSASVVLEKNIL